MASIMDAFNRAFEQGQSINRASVPVESDEDSAEESRKQDEKKRAKKRRMNSHRSKHTKSRKRATQFTVRHAVPQVSVTTKSFPEILSVEKHFTGTATESHELIVAETNFFTSKNRDNHQTHVRPFDFPYVRALIQRAPLPSFDIHKFNDREKLRANVEAVTRKYEEDFLREPVGSERPCLMKSNCEGLQISSARDRAFILREFLLPSEMKEYEKTGKYKTEQRLCLMCRRKELARAFINIRADGMSMKLDSTLQDYRNIVDVKGEYCLKDCILSSRHTFEGLLDPVVLHIRSAYRLKEIDGVRHYEQWRMAYPSTTQHFLFPAPSN